jgi:lathosterol oxidase
MEAMMILDRSIIEVIALEYLKLLVFAPIMYFLTAGTSYFIFFKLLKKKIHPKYSPDWNEIKQSMMWSMISLFGNVLLLAPINLLVIFNYSKVYYTVDQYGWPYIFLSFIGVLVWTETLIYWIHRALHTEFLYEKLHIIHHQFIKPTPWISNAFHPVDSFVQGLPLYIYGFFFPLHYNLYMFCLLFLMMWSVSIHNRFSILNTKWSFINYCDHHTLHHWYGKAPYNLGQYFTFWDRIAGTYKSPDELYKDDRYDPLS